MSGKLGRDFVAFLEIGRVARMLIDALWHEPAAEALVHPMGQPLGLGQIEIAAGRVEYAVEVAVGMP